MALFRRVVLGVFAVLTLAVLIPGCESLKQSKPIIPIQEYERMLVGSIDANYVGTATCLSTCHYHDKYRRDFEASTMGAQMSSTSGMPLVDCETCHGAGSRAIVGLTPERVEADRQKGIETACKFKTFIDIKNLPPAARSLMCLKCHTANATFNLHEWNSGTHAIADVTCVDCHNVHVGPDLIVSPRQTKDMCFKCHPEAMAEFSLRSHHPVKEGKVFCTDCHVGHGSMNKSLLREDTIKETCIKCHAEKSGPFVYEHADLGENCIECHKAHGSPYDALLQTQESFLCLQCHSGHRTSSAASTLETKGAYYTRCTDCHSSIHGTDLPSPGGGKFTN